MAVTYQEEGRGLGDRVIGQAGQRQLVVGHVLGPPGFGKRHGRLLWPVGKQKLDLSNQVKCFLGNFLEIPLELPAVLPSKENIEWRRNDWATCLTSRING